MDDKNFLVQSAFTFLNPRLFVEFIFVNKCIWCLYDKQKNRWFLAKRRSSDSKRIKGVLSSLRTPGGGRYPQAKFL